MCTKASYDQINYLIAPSWAKIQKGKRTTEVYKEKCCLINKLKYNINIGKSSDAFQSWC